MKKRVIITKVAELSGISENDCRKVLDAFENVFNSELSNSGNVMNAFDKVYEIMNFINSKRSYKH